MQKLDFDLRVRVHSGDHRLLVFPAHDDVITQAYHRSSLHAAETARRDGLDLLEIPTPSAARTVTRPATTLLSIVPYICLPYALPPAVPNEGTASSEYKTLVSCPFSLAYARLRAVEVQR
jgi:hypothetical protein